MPKKTAEARKPQPVSDEDEALDFDGLNNILGFRVRMAHTAMYRDFNAALKALEITQKQTATLWLIGANPGVFQSTLANALNMDRATMMAIIDRLERGRLVIRKRSATDRRRQELYITPNGQKTLAKVKSAIARHEQKFSEPFNDKELVNLLKGLDKLASVQ